MIPIKNARVQRATALVACAVVLAATAGCAENSDTGSQPAPTDGGADVELNQVLDRLEAEQEYQIGYTLPQFRDPYWVSVAYGIENEAEKAGVEVAVGQEAGSYANLVEQISQIDDMTQRGLDAILAAPVDRAGVASSLDNAGQTGTTIIGAGNLASSEAMDVGVTYSHIAAGEETATAMGEHLNGSGSVVMLNGPQGADWAILRDEGFKSKLEEDYPDITIIEEAWLNPDREAGQSTMEDWSQKHGEDIDAVFSAVNLTAEGAVLALRNSGQNGTTFVGTSAISQATYEMIEAGDIHFSYREPGQLVGRLAVQTAIRALEEKEVPNVAEAEGDEPFPKDVLYVETPPITTDNIEEYDPYLYDWAPDGWSP